MAYYNKKQKQIWNEVKQFDSSKFNDSSLRRQFEKLMVLGIAALDEVDSQKVTTLQLVDWF